MAPSSTWWPAGRPPAALLQACTQSVGFYLCVSAVCVYCTCVLRLCESVQICKFVNVLSVMCVLECALSDASNDMVSQCAGL